MRLAAVDPEVVGVIGMGDEPAVRVLFRRAGAPDFLTESPVTDSNRAPFPYEGNALPNELTGR
jgi:hypothetical protein